MEPKDTRRVEPRETSLTSVMTDLIEQYYDGKLTKTMVTEWLGHLDEDKRKAAREELEVGLSDMIDNLPE